MPQIISPFVVLSAGSLVAAAIAVIVYRRLAHHAWLAGSSLAAGIVLLWLVTASTWLVRDAAGLFPLWGAIGTLFVLHGNAAVRRSRQENHSGLDFGRHERLPDAPQDKSTPFL